MSVKREIPQIPPEYVVRLKHAGDKEFIKAEGLIYLGHLQGLKRVDVQVIQFPSQEHPMTCYARAVVETDLGVFSDYGSTSPKNKGQVGEQYPIELACTRARNRALRIATNCPLTSYEEMGMAPSEEGETHQSNGQPSAQPQRASAQNPVPAALERAKAAAGQPRGPANAPTQASAAQLAALTSLATTLRKQYGLVVQVPDACTAAQAVAKLADLQAEHARLQAGPCTQKQMDDITARVQKINDIYGVRVELVEPATGGEAEAEIARLDAKGSGLAKQREAQSQAVQQAAEKEEVPL